MLTFLSLPNPKPAQERQDWRGQNTPTSSFDDHTFVADDAFMATRTAVTLLAHRSVVIFFLHLLRSLSVLTHHCMKLLVVHSTNVPTLVITCLLICSTYFQASPTDGLRGCSFPAIVLTDTLRRSISSRITYKITQRFCSRRSKYFFAFRPAFSFYFAFRQPEPPEPGFMFYTGIVGCAPVSTLACYACVVGGHEKVNLVATTCKLSTTPTRDDFFVLDRVPDTIVISVTSEAVADRWSTHEQMSGDGGRHCCPTSSSFFSGDSPPHRPAAALAPRAVVGVDVAARIQKRSGGGVYSDTNIPGFHKSHGFVLFFIYSKAER